MAFLRAQFFRFMHVSADNHQTSCLIQKVGKLPPMHTYPSVCVCSQESYEVCKEHPENHQGHEDGCSVKAPASAGAAGEVPQHLAAFHRPPRRLPK